MAFGLYPLSRAAVPMRKLKSTPVALDARWIAASTTPLIPWTAMGKMCPHMVNVVLTMFAQPLEPRPLAALLPR